jgi:PAS domain-containing protein
MQRIADELEGLIVADAEGRYAYVNQRWSSLTGYTFEQVKGRYVRDVVRLSRVDEVLKTQKFVSGDAILQSNWGGGTGLLLLHTAVSRKQVGGLSRLYDSKE